MGRRKQKSQIESERERQRVKGKMCGFKIDRRGGKAEVLFSAVLLSQHLPPFSLHTHNHTLTDRFTLSKILLLSL